MIKMYKNFSKNKIVFGLMLALFSLPSIINAQNNASATKNKTSVAKKKISFISKWGPYAGNAKATADDIKKLVSIPITVVDSATKEPWTVLRYNFGWRKKEFFDDVEKGTRKVVFIPNVVTVHGQNTIPESWQKEVKEFVQSGEQLIIEEIIIQNPKTKESRMCKPILITVL